MKTLYQPIQFISFVKSNYHVNNRKFGNSTNQIIRNTHINSRGKTEEQLFHSSKNLIDNKDVRLIHKYEGKKTTIIQRKYKSYVSLFLFINIFYRLQVENPKRCHMQTYCLVVYGNFCGIFSVSASHGLIVVIQKQKPKTTTTTTKLKIVKTLHCVKDE